MMSNDLYPTTLSQVAAWARHNAVTEAAARDRYAQYVVLFAIANTRELRRSLVFKGGNALDFVLLPNRSTVDLDFSLDMDTGSDVATPAVLAGELQQALASVERHHNIRLRLHGVRSQPPGEARTFVTMQARIGYATSDQRGLPARMGRGDTSPQVIPVEVSLNEPLVENELHRISPELLPLRVSTLNDIAAEKLRALLQQRVRNRTRRQDVLDLAVMIRSDATIDLSVVSQGLLLKAAARNVPVSRQAFHHPEIADRARTGYDALASDTRKTFIPFDEAFAAVLAFVDTLDIPPE